MCVGVYVGVCVCVCVCFVINDHVCNGAKNGEKTRGRRTMERLPECRQNFGNLGRLGNRSWKIYRQNFRNLGRLNNRETGKCQLELISWCPTLGHVKAARLANVDSWKKFCESADNQIPELSRVRQILEKDRDVIEELLRLVIGNLLRISEEWTNSVKIRTNREDWKKATEMTMKKRMRWTMNILTPTRHLVGTYPVCLRKGSEHLTEIFRHSLPMDHIDGDMPNLPN